MNKSLLGAHPGWALRECMQSQHCDIDAAPKLGGFALQTRISVLSYQRPSKKLCETVRQGALPSTDEGPYWQVRSLLLPPRSGQIWHCDCISALATQWGVRVGWWSYMTSRREASSEGSPYQGQTFTPHFGCFCSARAAVSSESW